MILTNNQILKAYENIEPLLKTPLKGDVALIVIKNIMVLEQAVQEINKELKVIKETYGADEKEFNLNTKELLELGVEVEITKLTTSLKDIVIEPFKLIHLLFMF